VQTYNHCGQPEGSLSRIFIFGHLLLEEEPSRRCAKCENPVSGFPGRGAKDGEAVARRYASGSFVIVEQNRAKAEPRLITSEMLALERLKTVRTAE